MSVWTTLLLVRRQEFHISRQKQEKITNHVLYQIRKRKTYFESQKSDVYSDMGLNGCSTHHRGETMNAAAYSARCFTDSTVSGSFLIIHPISGWPWVTSLFFQTEELVGGGRCYGSYNKILRVLISG